MHKACGKTLIGPVFGKNRSKDHENCVSGRLTCPKRLSTARQAHLPSAPAKRTCQARQPSAPAKRTCQVNLPRQFAPSGVKPDPSFHSKPFLATESAHCLRGDVAQSERLLCGVSHHTALTQPPLAPRTLVHLVSP